MKQLKAWIVGLSTGIGVGAVMWTALDLFEQENSIVFLAMAVGVAIGIGGLAAERMRKRQLVDDAVPIKVMSRSGVSF